MTGRWILCVLLAAGVCRAQSEPIDESDKPAISKAILSHTQRFGAFGFPSSQAVTMVGWAEDVTRRFETLTGLVVPFAKGDRIDFRSAAKRPDAQGRIGRAQGVVDGDLLQRIRISSPEALDQEDLLETLTWMLVNRCAWNARSLAHAAKAPESPAWLSVGIAQNLYNEQRDRNLDLASRQQADGQIPAVSTLLRHTVLADGRWDEKSLCGLLVAFLNESKAPFGRILSDIGHGRAIDVKGLRVLLGYDSVDSLEAAWLRWLDRELANRVRPSIRSSDLASELRGKLVVRVAEYEIQGTNVPSGPVAMSGLIPYRDEPWMKPLCERLTMEVTRIAASGDTDFTIVAEAYVNYLQALAARKSDGQRRAATKPVRLSALLSEADAKLVAWESRTRRIREYMDTIEKRGPGEVPDRIKSYMDALEGEMR